MRKLLFLIFLFSATMTAQAQYNFDVDRDAQTGQTMYIGQCTFDDIGDEASFDWFTMSSNNYNPDPEITAMLKKLLPSCQITIFMGTWCEDTHNLLPKLYKTMLLSHCFTNYKMYGVDREKHSKANEEEAFKVTNVPTIIISKNGEELGRIVETTKSSIESDLFKIVASE